MSASSSTEQRIRSGSASPAASRLPILVGVGQTTQHELSPDLEQGIAPAPMDLAGWAAALAVRDTGQETRIARAIDTVVAIRLFSDSAPRRSHEFGRAENPPRSIARRVGANPRRVIYAEVGGNTPQKYVNSIAEDIARGRCDCALLAGGEALRTLKAALRGGITLDWQEADEGRSLQSRAHQAGAVALDPSVDGALDDRGFGTVWLNASEIKHDVTYPIQVYPLFEQAIRAHRGVSVGEHLRSMARLFAPLSAVAAANPYAVSRTSLTVDQLATPTGTNRFVVHPYPRLMNARDSVDQAAAVIMTSVEKATELGIARERWVFLRGCADLNERLYVQDRVDYWSSPALRRLGERSLGMAGVGIDDVAHLDFYSCFPSAVEIAAAEFGVAENDSRGLSLTGGLPFFGGPGNNYSMHAIAEAVARCRDSPGDFALVTANGGALTKHSAGVYSTEPGPWPWRRPDPSGDQGWIDGLESPEVVDAHQGRATVETCSVRMSEAQDPQFAVILARTPSGQRFAAKALDRGTMEALLGDDVVGLEGESEVVDEVNLFSC